MSARDLGRLEALLSGLIEGVVEVDVAGVVVRLNAAARRLTGWSEAEAVGSRLEEVLPVTEESSGKGYSSAVSDRLRIWYAGSALEGASPIPSDVDVTVVVLDGGGTIRSVGGGASGLGWEGADLVGRLFVELVDTADRPGWARALDRADGAAGRIRLLDGGGGFRDVRCTASPLVGERGERVGSTLLVSDASSVRELQLQLYAAQRMESVGLFTGGIAHDFNNLLSLILSYATMARSALPVDALPAQDLDEVIDASRRAAGLVRQLLTFGGKRRDPREHRQWVDLGAVVEDLGRMLLRIVGEHVRLVVEARPGLRVYGDAGQLEQVVMNLAINARDAMSGGGTLTLRAADHEDGRVVLEVSDTGGGITPATLERIFEPFFSTKGKAGTGLGLTVTRSIVHDLGGVIEVDSSPAGTRFRVLLPSHDARPNATPPPVPEPRVEPPRRDHVLVVEDEEGLRALVVRVLEGAGYEVTAAADAAEAMAAARRLGGALQLLLLDRVLPDMVGPQLAVNLRAACPNARVVYTSGYPDGLEGLDGVVLAKPFEPEALLDAMRRARSGVSSPSGS
jgi:two-component system cell cycle sensor histidine kinase/response regulator CckA